MGGEPGMSSGGAVTVLPATAPVGRRSHCHAETCVQCVDDEHCEAGYW